MRSRALFCQGFDQTRCLCELAVARLGCRASLELLHTRINACLKEFPGKNASLFETLQRDMIGFRMLGGPQAPSIYYEGIAASHLSPTTTEYGGGVDAEHAWLILQTVPVRQNLWKQNRHC